MFDIQGKVALVTGGASGIGLAVCKALLDNGLKGLAVADINEKNGEIAMQNIKSQYGDNKAIFVKLDVSNRVQFHDAFKSTIDAFKHLDILINSAGILLEKQWEREIAVNLTGTVTGSILAIEEYLPKYKTGNEAIILNVSSVMGLENYGGAPIYSATKGGIISLTRSLGINSHYESTRVRVMAICPGATITPIAKTITDDTYLSAKYSTLLKKEFNCAPQKVTCVSNAMIQLIKEGENGSIWVSEDSQPPYQIKFMPRQQSQK